MPRSVGTLKKAYDMLGNDKVRALALSMAELVGIKKDVVKIDINDVCNIKCIFCATHLYTGTGKHDMSLDDFKIIIDKFSPSTRLLYLGCEFEPLATRDLHKYIEYACNSGIPFISYPTNGLRLNDDIVRAMVDCRLSELIVSIQGYEEESYNRIQFGSNFEKVMSGLDSLVAYKKSRNSELPVIRFNTILLASNLRNFDKLLGLIARFDVKTVQFRELIDTPGQNNPEEVAKEKISNIDKTELEIIARDIKVEMKRLAEKGVDIIIPSSLMAGDEIRPKLIKERKKSCCIPCFSYWIDFKGNVQSCPYIDNPVIGNALTDSMAEIRKKGKGFRRMALKGKCNQSSCTINMDEARIF